MAAIQERKTKPKPFQNSLSALAQIALYESGADGYAFFRKDTETSEPVRIDTGGVEITKDAVAGELTGIVTYAMEADGILAFAFHDEDRARRVRPQLDRIAAAIEAVWTAARSAVQYSQLASQVADLETRLMDSKIADRVRGLLSNSLLNNGSSADSVEAIARHVEGVLRPPAAGRILEQLTQGLEEEVEERRLTNRAKAILQSVHGMSEEEAHAHLRRTSRKSRRKLKDVAVELIEGHPVEQVTLRSVP